VRQACAFLVELRKQPGTNEMVGERRLDEWLARADRRAAASDPLERGETVLFREIADVTEWSYRY
jgi:hypothetical protein